MVMPSVTFTFLREKDCQAALALFSGRWYAGRQLHCEFCPVTRWKTAICGESWKREYVTERVLTHGIEKEGLVCSFQI